MTKYWCEAGTAGTDPYGAPIVRYCGAPADLYPKRPRRGVIQVALCPQHAYLVEGGES